MRRYKNSERIHNYVSDKGPCGNGRCDTCYPIPHWEISEHRIQHIIYNRKIKAATQEEALKIYEEGTAWPSSYDDIYGEIIQKDPVNIEKLPPSKFPDINCWHKVREDSEFRKFMESSDIKRPDNFASLSPEQQWEVDKQLGILDSDDSHSD